MSNTIRRSKFNKKKRPFIHYWEVFSEKEVQAASYLAPWQYHSDNYYTKDTKERKQFYKNYADRKIRRESKTKLSHISPISYDIVLDVHGLYCVRWAVH